MFKGDAVRRVVWLFVLPFAFCLLPSAAAVADEPDNAALRAEIQVLKDRLSKLERQVSPATFTGASGIGEKAGLPTLELPSGLSGLGMSGYVDTSYVYNFSQANAGSPTVGSLATTRTNRGRVFDLDPNGFTIQAAELVFEKTTSDSSPIGFRTDLFFGDDAEVIHATGLGEAAGTGNVADVFDLQQAYVTYKAPVGSGLDFKVGKFVTLLGAEVIESPANWNFSRSYMFGYSIPFTHTGALVSYPILGEWGSLTTGVVNGWDIVDENNQFKTMIGSLALTPYKDVSLSINGITGAERTKDNGNDRTVLDLVGTWKPFEQLTLMANYDYGREASITQGVTGTAGPDSGHWQGLALYAKYDLTPKWSLAGRWEWFDDSDNIRTGLTSRGGTTLSDINFQEWTLTSQWTLHDHMLARLEYRHDGASERVFFHGSSGFIGYQDTIATELVYHF